MNKKDIPAFDSFTEEETKPQFLSLSTATETIDLDAHLTRDVTESGSYDVSTVRESFVTRLLHALPIPAVLIDRAYRLTFCNESWSRLGANCEQLQGLHLSALFEGSRAAEQANKVVEQVFGDRKPRVMEQKLVIGSRHLWARLFLRSVRAANERLILGMVEDLTLEKRQLVLMELIKQAKIEWERTVDVVPEGIALVDAEHRIIRLNKAMADRAGIPIREALGQPCYKIVHGTDTPPYFCPFSKVRREGQAYSVDYRVEQTGAFLSESLSPLKVDRSGLRRCALVIQDMTEQKKLEEELHRQATRDGLTDLFNRRQTFILLEAACKAAARYGQPLSLCLVDIDNLKEINDQHGHHAGDRVLAAFADVVGKQLRGADIPGRYGGDEFIIAFPNTPLERAAQTMTRMRSVIDQLEFHEDSISYKTTFSAGLVQLSPGETSASALVREADRALYEAKRRGRNCIICTAPGQVEWQF